MRKFEPGNVYSTPGVNAKLEDAGFMRFMIVSLNRHINGDWGHMLDGAVIMFLYLKGKEK